MQEQKEIRVITYKDGDLWVAQCLEYDIAAHAADLETLHARLLVALDAEREESVRRNGVPFAGIDPAPARFHEMGS